MDERRKFPRFKANVDVYWKKVAHERTAQHLSGIKDVSLGGVCLVLHPGIVAGDILELEIELLHSKKISCRARVAWVDADARIKGRKEPVIEGGVEFLDMS